MTVLSASAQSLRFYATPHRVYEGDAVRFVYLDRTNGVPVPGVIPRASILALNRPNCREVLECGGWRGTGLTRLSLEISPKAYAPE